MAVWKCRTIPESFCGWKEKNSGAPAMYVSSLHTRGLLLVDKAYQYFADFRPEICPKSITPYIIQIAEN